MINKEYESCNKICNWKARGVAIGEIEDTLVVFY